MHTSNVTPSRLPSQSNWLKFIEMEQAGNLECLGGSEYPLYSDVGIRGEISAGLGPYTLLNALPMGSGTNADIVMVLRSFIFEVCRPERFSSNPKTDVQRFHGGHLPEEITALISLGLGIRLKAGDANRHFDGNDPLGRFRAYSSRPKPSLLVNPERPIIPMPEDVLLTDIQVRLKTIPKLNASLYIELVRSARAYQDALWISETEPHLCSTVKKKSAGC